MNFAEHLEIQDRLNCVINPDWRNAGYRWSDAAMVEAVEAFDHLAWKWWKAGTDNMPQFRLELVDIYHFLLCATYEESAKEFDAVAAPAEMAVTVGTIDLERGLELRNTAAVSGGLRDMLRLFIADCATGLIPSGVFFRLCELADLSMADLDRMYRAKGVLNLFRQANGYKTGSYIKEWAGHEDNFWLERIMRTAPNATPDELMDELAKLYHHVADTPTLTAAVGESYPVTTGPFTCPKSGIACVYDNHKPCQWREHCASDNEFSEQERISRGF